MQETKKNVPDVSPEELAQMLRKHNRKAVRLANDGSSEELYNSMLDSTQEMRKRFKERYKTGSSFTVDLLGDIDSKTVSITGTIFALAILELEGRGLPRRAHAAKTWREKWGVVF